MNKKTSKNRLVEFFATSPRLARHSTIHDLRKVVGFSKTPKYRFDLVVLSHPDDDCRLLCELRSEPVVSEAFHLLFTERTTHPDQIAQWMRNTNIRSENRLHIVRVENLDAPEVAELLGRVSYSLESETIRDSIIDAYLGGDVLYVRGPKRRMLHVPVASLSALRDQPPGILRNLRIDPDGSFIHWPDIDVHLGWKQFLQAIDPAELQKAQQRSADFNRRYGAAIRKLREQAGITQAQVEGITERQLRRVEQGKCRATMSALTALANAHKLEVIAYMGAVAQLMTE